MPPRARPSATVPEVARLAVRVRPGSSRTRVGGRHADRLVVAVTARAVDGAATAAVLAAVAAALGVRPRQVRLVSGGTSRDKLLEVELSVEELARRVRVLEGEVEAR